MQIVLHRDKENPSNVYLQLVDDEAKEWFGRMERFIDNKRLMFDRKGIEKNIDIRELDDFFKDYEKDQTQLDPIDERWKRQFLFAVPIATARVKEETGEIVITAKKQKQ
jgi:hypothetical protein